MTVKFTTDDDKTDAPIVSADGAYLSCPTWKCECGCADIKGTGAVWRDDRGCASAARCLLCDRRAGTITVPQERLDLPWWSSGPRE